MILDDWSIPGVVYTRYLGTVTGTDMIESVLQKSGDERLDHVEYIISDWSRVKRPEIKPVNVQELIACLVSISKICPRAKNGSIFQRNDEGLALAAWYKHLGDILPWEIAIFDTIDEAFNFYNLDRSQLEGSAVSTNTTHLMKKTIEFI